jgi:predicted O-methyltransferase YrrM
MDIRDVIRGLPHYDSQFNWADEPNYYETFHAYLKERYDKLKLNPLSVLEIGCLFGYSAVTILDALPSIRAFHWIDNEQYRPGSNQIAFKNIRHYLEDRQVTTAWKHSTADYAIAYPRPDVDLVYIDGDHSYDGKMMDLGFAFRLDPMDVIVDDYFTISACREATNDFAKAKGLKFHVIPTSRGMAHFKLP